MRQLIRESLRKRRSDNYRNRKSACIHSIEKSVSYPFHTPKIKPAAVPKLDQPTSGGNEPKKTHSHRMKAASQDFSHSSATEPSQTNSFPDNTKKAIPDAPMNKDAITVAIFFGKVISSHIVFIR